MQVGRQTGRRKHTTWLFLVVDYDYKHWGTPSVQEQSVVKWSNTRQTHRPGLVRIPEGGIGGSLAQLIGPPIPSLYSTLVQILLTTTLLTPPPKKNGTHFQGDRGLRIKKTIGRLFCCAK